MSLKKLSPSKTTLERGGISRREFARRAALTTAAVAALPVTILREAVASDAAPLHSSLTAAPTLPATPGDAEVEAKIQAILRKYSSPLHDQPKTATPHP